MHVPYNNETHGLINRDLLQYFMDDAILINTSRGEIVDEEALLEAINQRGLKAGLDVFRDEPAKGEGSFRSQVAAIFSCR